MKPTLVFGYAAGGLSDSSRENMSRLIGEVARRAGFGLALYEAGSYESLGRAVHDKTAHIAWLPPIPFIALDRQSGIVPLVSPVRAGGLRFESVVIVNRSSMLRSVRELDGANAAWVDPFSASGYVFPRIELADVGVDPNGFASETFFHSHEAVVRAVACHEADFGATYATVGRDGEVLRAAWLDMPELADGIRVLGQLGSLPADVIAARADMPKVLTNRLLRAFVSISRDPGCRMLMLDVLGAEELRPIIPRGYDVLRAETERASAEGLL